MKAVNLLRLATAVFLTISIPARAADTAAPANVSPAVAEVARLASSGVGDDVVLGYVKNAQAPFKLSADDILYLKNKGVSSAVITAMLSHDSATQPATATTAPAATTEAPPSETPDVQMQVEKNPPPEVAAFYEKLAPFGVWVKMDNFGWCWQPHEATNRMWRPYCDGGHWANTDSGWFWESEYPWGETTFHYGRWALNSQAGWVWAPDRTWGPAWVIWRTVEDLVGWAPLPPRSVFNSREGWKFNGMTVSPIFDFGLKQEVYTFVPLKEFTQHDLAAHRIGVAEVARVFGRTTIINGYTFNNQTLVNQGISTKQVAAATHAPIPQLTVYDVAADAPIVPPGPGLPPRVYRHGFIAPLRPPLVEMQIVDARHPFIHHPQMGHPGGPGHGGPGGPGGPGHAPGGPGGGSPRPGGGGGAPGKKGP